MKLPLKTKQTTYLFILIITFVCIAGCKDNSKNKSFDKPNIVLINVDDLGWKDLGYMGSDYYETPNIDALAKEGMVFTRAYAGAANCAPSRACLISGRNTTSHGVYTVSSSERGNSKTRRLIPVENTLHLSNDLHTLPRMLKSAGYVTSSFGKWHVGEDPLKQGVDVNVGGSAMGSPGKDGYFAPYKIKPIEDGPEGEYLTDRLTDEAISFIQKQKDTSFFLYLPYYTVHTPLMGKPELKDYYAKKSVSNGQDNPVFAAMVHAMDENVGRLLQTISNLGLEKNTLVIFTSDNGGIRAVSNQSPLRAGKGSYYEGGIRVPLILKWPGHIPEGSKNNNAVSNLDFYPTLQEIVKPTKKAPVLDGENLIPQLKKDTIITRDLFFHFPVYLQAYSGTEDDGRDPLFRTRPGSVVISGNWKLHEYFEDNDLELYNLQEDLGERQNLVEQYPEKTKELYNKLLDWRKANNAPIPTEKNPEFDAGFEQKKIEAVDLK